MRGTAVLVPGFTGSKEDFIAVLAPLTAAGWQVVAFDQRGQFEVAGLDRGRGPIYTAEALAADVVAVADAPVEAGRTWWATPWAVWWPGQPC